jgi:hypothetical protein
MAPRTSKKKPAFTPAAAPKPALFLNRPAFVAPEAWEFAVREIALDAIVAARENVDREMAVGMVQSSRSLWTYAGVRWIERALHSLVGVSAASFPSEEAWQVYLHEVLAAVGVRANFTLRDLKLPKPTKKVIAEIASLRLPSPKHVADEAWEIALATARSRSEEFQVFREDAEKGYESFVYDSRSAEEQVEILEKAMRRASQAFPKLDRYEIRELADALRMDAVAEGATHV